MLSAQSHRSNPQMLTTVRRHGALSSFSCTAVGAMFFVALCCGCHGSRGLSNGCCDLRSNRNDGCVSSTRIPPSESSCRASSCAADECAPASRLPRELCKVSLPSHVIEPPDVLLIESVNSLRPPSSPIVPGDGLTIRVGQSIPIDQARDDAIVRNFKQIDGLFVVGTDGYIHLGPVYGSLKVAGMSISQIQIHITSYLKKTLKSPQVLVILTEPHAKQHISGEHLVRPDGTVSLGIYGDAYVSGMTLQQAKSRIEAQLASHIHAPEVNVDVLAYNSKVYYVITDGGGAGEQVFRFPCMGNETVLDAIANINGLPTVASKKDIWIARPSPASNTHDQVMRVDWAGISRGGAAATNYQVLPGDRVYVQADKLVTFDTFIAKLTAPFERIFGFMLLGNGTVRAIQNGHRQQQGSGFSSF